MRLNSGCNARRGPRRGQLFQLEDSRLKKLDQPTCSQTGMSKNRLFSLDKLFVCVGWTLVCVGLFANEWVLTAAFSSDGVLERETRTIIRSVDLLLLIAGTVIILARRFVYSKKALLRLSQTYPRTVCFLIGTALSASLLLSLEGIFYFINHQAEKGAGS